MREVFDIKAMYFQELLSLLKKSLNIEELEHYLTIEKHTHAILKLFLEDKDSFHKIQHIVPTKFYKNLFRCEEIFNNLSTNKIRKIKKRNSKTIKELRKVIPDQNVINHIISGYLESPSIIIDSVVELTEDYVSIEKYVEYYDQYDRKPRNRIRIIDKSSGNSINSIYLNKHIKSHLFQVSRKNQEYTNGTNGFVYAGNWLKLMADETSRIIEDLNIKISNSPFLFCSCIRNLFRSKRCYKCSNDLLYNKCINTYCTDYVVPEIVKCQKCSFWYISWYE
jgi:hypothetical protein